MEELLKYSSREFEIWKIRNNVQIYECLPNDCEKLKQRIWAERLLLEVEVLGNNIKLILALPRAFPYNLPSVYLHSKEDSKYKNLPHVDKNLFICTANPEQTVQNINNPIGICNEIIQIAKNILEQGTNKTNFSDFEDEFLAYWSEEAQKTTFSIVEQSNEVKDIVVVKFKNSDGYLDYLLADSKLDATTWLSNIGIDTRADVDYERGVYFPIKTAQFHIPPQKNRGVVEFLKGNNLTSLYGKLNINKRPCIVLCEYKKDDTSMLFAWKHQEAQIFKQVGSKKQQVKTLDGFRKGCNKISRFELTGYAKDTPIIKIDVHNLRKDRIFLRSGNSLSVNQEFRINLIGCGSIGSFLMEKLIYTGFNNFDLFDNENLMPENLARHIGGTVDLGENKAQLLKNKLCRRYPFLDVKCYNNKIEEIVLDESRLECFNYADLNIICTGNYTNNLMLNNMIKVGKITKPTLFIWVEANLAAGHAILVNPKDFINIEDLHKFENNKLVYKYSVLPPGNYTKREHGCQSIYLPYASLDIDDFTGKIAYVVQKYSKTNMDKSMIYRWIKNNEDENISNTKLEIVNAV